MNQNQNLGTQVRLLVALISCWVPLISVNAAAADPINAEFMADGVGEPGKIAENSAEARAILTIVNESARSTLSGAKNGVGLDAKAAENIYHYRSGDDEMPGTKDDQIFDSLAELDAIPYVGPESFTKIQEYAKANGYFPNAEDPFSTACCQGEPMTWDQASGRFVMGETSTPIGRYQIHGRSRICNRVTGCLPWKLETAAEITPSPMGQSRLVVRGNEIHLLLEGDRSPDNTMSASITCQYVGRKNFGCSNVSLYRGTNYHSAMLLLNKDFRIDGLVTNGCMRFTANAEADFDSTTPTQKQVQRVWYGRF